MSRASLASSRITFAAALVCALCVFGVQTHYAHRNASATTDEVKHLAAGVMAWRWGAYAFDLDVPPLAKVVAGAAALPLKPRLTPPEKFRPPHTRAGLAEFVAMNGDKLDAAIARGRMTTLAWGLLAGIVLAFFAARLYGVRGTYLPLALYAFSPTLLAHAGFLTTDMAAVALSLGALLCWHLARGRSRARAVVPAGVLLGLALATKYTAAIIAVAVVILEFQHALSRNSPGFRAHARRLGTVAGVAYVTLCFVYLFNFRTWEYITALGDPAASPYAAHPLMDAPEMALSYFAPIPIYYVIGLRAFMHNALHGFPTFFLGEVKPAGGWYVYFWVAYLLKTATPALLLTLLAVLTTFSKRLPARKDAGEKVLVVPVIFIMLAATVSSANIGVRHILLVYPLLFLLTGRLALVIQPGRKRAVLYAVAIIFTIGESLAGRPYYLTHFNIFAGGPTFGSRFLSNSNVTYHHHLNALRETLATLETDTVYLAYGVDYSLLRHYGILGDRTPVVRPFPPMPDGKPKPGWYAAGIIERQGLWTGRPTPIEWLDAYTPMFTIGHDIAFYKIE